MMMRAMLVAVLLLVATCDMTDEGACGDSDGSGAPYMPLDGTWQGKLVISPGFQTNWTLELEEHDRVEVRGTFKSDWAYHIRNYHRPDTIRGDLQGDYCSPDIEFSFGWRAPNAQGEIDYSCRFDGLQGDLDYFAGLTVCQHGPDPWHYVAATYFERECGPSPC